jgi:hypothetical protein
MPIVQVLLIGVVGAYLAPGYSNVLTTSARRDMNKVSPDFHRTFHTWLNTVTASSHPNLSFLTGCVYCLHPMFDVL